MDGFVLVFAGGIFLFIWCMLLCGLWVSKQTFGKPLFRFMRGLRYIGLVFIISGVLQSLGVLN